MKKIFGLTPRQVIDIYASRNGGEAHTRSLIAMALREGTLQVRAAYRWTSHEPAIIKAWKAVPVFEDGTKPPRQILSRALWWRSARWSDDVLDWDFRRARMMVTVSLDPFERVMLKGVRFRSDQIREVLSPGSLALEAGSFDKVHSSEMWRRFWHDVVILAAGSKESVKLSGLAHFKTGDELVDHIISSLHNEDAVDKKQISDEELATALSQRHPFNLKDAAVLKEIKALRRTFKLKTWGQGGTKGL